MAKDILIIGSGGIGQRHIQACAKLKCDEYVLHVVDPNTDAHALVKSIWKEASGGQNLFFYSSINELLLKEVNLLIIATQSDVRYLVIKQLVEFCQIHNCLLEKVLFQRIDEYEKCLDLLNIHNSNAWINCPRRMWQGYIRLNEYLSNKNIFRITVEGINWDIGCNGVHFLDLISYLNNGGSIKFRDVNLEPAPVSAKRNGMIHVRGNFVGICEGNQNVVFCLNSTSGEFEEYSVLIEIEENSKIHVVERNGSMIMQFFTNDKKIDQAEYRIPFQSELTNLFVEDVFSGNQVRLSDYRANMKIHMEFIQVLTNALSQHFNKKLEFCPVT